MTATVLELIDRDCDCDLLVDIRPQHRHHNIRPAAGALVDLIRMMKMNHVHKFFRSCGILRGLLGHRPKTP